MSLDWVAGLFELIGLWKVGEKKKFGFLLNITCNVLWIAYVLSTKSTYGLLLVVVPALFINVRNYIKWRREENASIS